MKLLTNKVIKEQQNININTNKKLNLTRYILQGGPDSYREVVRQLRPEYSIPRQDVLTALGSLNKTI